MTMPARIAADGPASFLRRGETVFVTAGPAEPAALATMIARDPALADGVTFRGVFIPGINGTDYAALAPAARMEGLFPAPAFRAGLDAGRHLLRPMHYVEMARFMAATPVDTAILHLSPPDRDGLCSFGVNADFAPIAAVHARRLVGFVNPAMPRTSGEPGLPFARLDAVVEADAPLADFPDALPDAASEAIAGHVAGLVEDGATIQIGIGKAPTAILRALRGHRRLKVHSGMITDAVVDLVESGAIAATRVGPAIVAGSAIGTGRVRTLAGETGLVALRNVLHTHDPVRLAGIDRLVSINAALSVDLLGQVNAERLGARLVSATGGLIDFMRGARASPGGVSIVALPAMAGRHSRIVPMFAEGPVSVPRVDTDVVVTEHGVARLRHLDLDARAEALIAIAGPGQRAGLAEAWRRMRAGL